MRKKISYRAPISRPRENYSRPSPDGNFYHGLVNGLAISMVLWGFIILGVCWVVM